MNFTVLKTYGVPVPTVEGPRTIPIYETFDADPAEPWVEDFRSKGSIIATALLSEEN